MSTEELEEKIVRKEVTQYLIDRNGFLSTRVSRILTGLKRLDWFEIRRKYITSSNIPKILRCCGTKSSDYLICVKTGSKYKPVDNEHVHRGKRLEAIGIRMFALETHKKIVPMRFTHGRYYRHPRYSYLASTIDGLTEDGELIEVKAPQKFRDRIPYDHYAQIQTDMAVMDIEKAHYVQIVEDKIKTMSVERDLSFLPAWIFDISAFVTKLNAIHFKRFSSSDYFLKDDEGHVSEETLNQRRSFMY